MKIYFNDKLGKIYGIFDSLYYCWNFDNEKRYIGDMEFKIDKGLIEELKKIRKRQENTYEDMDFFFDYESKLYKAFIDFDLIIQSENIEDYLKKIISMNEYEIRRNLINYYCKLENNKDIEIEKILKSNKNFVEFIKRLKSSDQSKWKMFCFSDDIKGSTQKFISLIRRFISCYYEFYGLNKEFIIERNEYIENILNEKGFEFIPQLNEDTIKFRDFDDIYITVSYFNTYKLYIEANNKTKTCYITIGRRNSLVTQLLDPEAELRENILVFKNLSDETKFKIVTFILTGEKFAQEIADKTNLSNSTVNYHMNQLVLSGLIVAEKRENKVYYGIKKDRLRECINYLSKKFQL